MGARLWLSLAAHGLFHAALLFGAAGTWRWPAAWAYLFLFYGAVFTITRMLARHDPALLAERRKWPIQQGQPLWDRIILAVFMLLWLAWMPLMGLDAVRWRWSVMPVAWQWVGAIGVVASTWIWYLTFRANTFLAPVVRIQAERGHTVVSTGPYAVVRHPLYASAVVFFLSSALMLGAWSGVLLGLLMSALLVVRTVKEDRALQQNLAGYRDYAARVPYRLVPLVW